MIYPWQQTAWQKILERKKQNKLPHALLLTGIDGIGKADFAKAYANLLLCHNQEIAPCNNCAGCHLFSSGNHPDFYIAQPEEKSKIIKIDQIRELTQELTQTAQQGGNKIAIISPAAMMNSAASNALLKTLEEPPRNVFIILVSSNHTLLPATIRSRCQRLELKPPIFNEALHWLREKNLNSNLELLLKLTHNAPLRAYELAQTDELAERSNIINNFILLTQNKIDAPKFAELCKNTDLNSLVNIVMSLTIDLIKIKIAGSNNLLNHDFYEPLTHLAKSTTTEKLFSYLDKLIELNKYLAKNINLNQQLAIEDLAIIKF